jgi:hypothetical protein
MTGRLFAALSRIMRWVWIGVGGALGLAGCMRGGLNLTPGPIQLYEGAPQPAESVAVIQNDRNMFLVSIDGHSLQRWARTHDVVAIQVLPGKRILVAQPSARAGFVSMEAVRIEFLAQAGHRYVISRRIGGGTAGTTWTPVFMDTTTGREVP